jgi:spore germination cell wall hydrolase CwlJ-like protein
MTEQPMDDAVLLALCIWSEAAGEPLGGKQAIAQVVMNRMRDRYASDGTVAGTVLHPNQFSGFWFDFVGGKYTRVCWTADDAQHHAQGMLLRARHQAVWDTCMDLAEGVLDGSTPPDKGLDRAVLYLNPAIIPKLPAWAAPDKTLGTIGHHTFYRA